MPSVRKIRRTRRPLIALLVLVVALVVGYAVDASHSHPLIGTVALSALPPQAAQTVRLIEAGGPFPYPDDDGIVFHDYGDVLPSEPRGYYREYTVPTPGVADRGRRRIVTGRDGQFYWTSDHDDSFERIDVHR